MNFDPNNQFTWPFFHAKCASHWFTVQAHNEEHARIRATVLAGDYDIHVQENSWTITKAEE